MVFFSGYSTNFNFRSFIERAPDIYFYSTLVVHLLELLWSMASAAVGSAMVSECPAEPMIPISLIGISESSDMKSNQ